MLLKFLKSCGGKKEKKKQEEEETMCKQKPETFAVWPLTEKFVDTYTREEAFREQSHILILLIQPQNLT